MNAITTDVFSPQPNLAALQFQAEITPHSVVKQQGGLLLEPVFAKSVPELLTCQKCPNLQCIWREGAHSPVPADGNVWCGMS